MAPPRRRRPRPDPALGEPISMRRVGELMGGKTVREVRRALRKVEAAKEVRLMFRPPNASRQAQWWTTSELLYRHAPELVRADRLIVAGLEELRELLVDRLEKIEEAHDSLKSETLRRFGGLGARVRELERAKNTNGHDPPSRARDPGVTR